MDIPTNLQCSYCIRNQRVGGECRETFKRESCLAFKRNSLGAIRNKKGELRFLVSYDIPPIGVWDTNFELANKFDTEIRINKIFRVKYSEGEIILQCDYDYMMDDFNEDIKSEKQAIKSRSNLILIKPKE